MPSTSVSYKNIVKTTFLFSFVKIFNILMRLGLNKIVAVLLGPQGMGVIGLFSSTLMTVQTIAGLGIPQSSIKNISEAKNSSDNEKLGYQLTITKKIILGTALIGALITFFAAPVLSQWTFQNNNYITEYRWLSIAAFFMIIGEGQKGMMTGVRNLQDLAKASVYGSLLGLITGAPFYYFFGLQGIVPSLITAAISTYLLTWYFSNKIEFKEFKLNFTKILVEGRSMIIMGIGLMYVGFTGTISDLVIKSYIASNSNLEMVGLFQAGVVILSGYFGIILSAMTTDYYPRISAINQNNIKLADEANTQSEVGLLMMFPLIILFVILLPHVLSIIYSPEFVEAQNYIKYALFGFFIIICSNTMGMILLAKQKVKIFIISVTFQKIAGVLINILLFDKYGLIGLGIAYLSTSLIHLLLMQFIMHKYYKIYFSKTTLLFLFSMLIIIMFTMLLNQIDSLIMRYTLQITIALIVSYFSLKRLNKVMGVNIIEIFQKRIGNGRD